jgi:hypothetical protein
MSDEIDRIIQTINEQKGEMLAHNCLIISLLRAFPLDHRSVALREFDTECDIARTVLLNSSVPEVLLKSFENHVGAVNGLRYRRPDSDDNKIA